MNDATPPFFGVPMCGPSVSPSADREAPSRLSLAPPPPSAALTRPEDLVSAGLAPARELGMLHSLAQEFRIRLTPEMRAAIGRDAPEGGGKTGAGAGHDPVALQFVPDAREAIVRPEEMLDPIGDGAHAPVPGLTHRYPDRVILHITKTCDVYCRFCFRRETVGETGPMAPGALAAALDYIARTPAVREVILTGGDPLTLSVRRLEDVLTRLSAIAHVTTLRFHSRVPVVAPERISAELLAVLRRTRPAVWMVLHTNHAQELTPAARAAITRLVEGGVPVLSQSVLLRGVNDTVGALGDLLRALQDLRVKPYYLHHCDLARGTSHFRTTIAEGRALMAALRGAVSGAAMPSYVLDIPGGHGKVPITADYFTPGPDPGSWWVTDWQGRLHRYDDPER